ncbi:unnamed protein product [Lasius platythorax]|uniref:ATP-dependent DNA helicase n=1 Tax=Lasius platythorax TaxID=488582 RepID=A0AAV2MWJ7_9HYME
MAPGIVPQELQDLSVTKQMLNARVHPVMTIYQVRANGRPGQYRYKGNIEQDITEIATRLPKTPSHLNIIIMQRQGVSGHSNFRVRRNKVLNALRWLQVNNPYYRDIQIADEVLESLPIDGNISQNLHYIDESGVSKEDIEDDDIVETAVPMQQQQRQQSVLEHAIQWPTGNSFPINKYRTEGYLSMAFPHLFPDGMVDYTDFRQITKLSYSEWTKFLIEYHDHRYARDPRFRFHALNTMQRHESIMRSGVFAKKNDFTGNMEQLAAEYNRNHNIVNKLLCWASKIRGSAPYLYQRKLELQAMVSQLGVPTLFLTLSSADLWWPCMYRHLGVSPGDHSEKELSKIMQRKLNENPRVADEYFAKRVDEYMKILGKKFNIQDFWWRFEYQHRGSPHIHAVLWMDGAPDVRTFDSQSTEQLAIFRQYYDSLVSAINPNINEPPAEHHPSRLQASEINLMSNQHAQLLNRVQRHTRCGTYCLRGRVGHQKCRFNFPKDLLSDSKLEKDDKGIWTFTLKRNDSLLNDHNTFVAESWRANTDCKIIASEYAIINYLSKYASKAEPQSSNYKQFFNDIVSSSTAETPAKQVFSRLLIRIVGQRDISACEVMHLLNGEPLFHCSRLVSKIYIGSNDYVLIPSNDDNDFVPQDIFDFYKNRSAQLENMTLRQFACDYHIVRKCLIKCRKQRVLQIIPKVIIGVSDEQEETFYKQRVMLFKPWRDVDSLKSENTWKNTYISSGINLWELADESSDHDDDTAVVDTPENEFYEWMQLAAAQPLQPISDTDIGYRNIDRENDWYLFFDKYPDILNQLDFIKINKDAFSDEREIQIESINFNQHQQQILNFLHDQLQGNTAHKLTIVQGVAGSGKSCIIRQMVCDIEAVCGSNSVLLMVPTGIAANNIDGCTIHSALSLTQTRSGQIRDLTGEAERKFQN